MSVIFYEKPGCTGNAQQKQALQHAGLHVECRSLLAEPWTRDTLHSYLKQLPVSQWFNRSAPKIKSGSIDTDSLDAETALALLIEHPLLIRRPLLAYGEFRTAGFDPVLLSQVFGLPLSSDIKEVCTHSQPCHSPHGHALR